METHRLLRLLVPILLLLAPVQAPAKADQAQALAEASALVEALMDDHLSRVVSGQPPVLNDPEAAQLYFVDSLAIEGLQGALGFDPLIDAQSIQVSDLSVRPDPETPMLRGAAQVRVDLTNMGKPVSLLYTLVRTEPTQSWQISDIRSPEHGWSLSALLRDAGIETAAAGPADVVLATASESASVSEPKMARNGQSSAGQASARDLLVILDASGSMWGQLEGVAKIETARKALAGLVNDLPPQTRMGLMAYGHRRQGDCTDIELVLPIATQNPDSFIETVAEISPNGKTPIASSLRAAADYVGPGADVLLVSDGLEVCDGDPCAAAAFLAEQGIRTRVHVVGFDLSEQENAALQCVAEQGGGRYFTANSADALADALSEVARMPTEPPITVAEPEPAPETRVLFEETFDGLAIDETWTLQNPEPALSSLDGEGALFTAVAGNDQQFDDERARNRYLLDQPPPEGDFRLVADLRMALQTRAELAWVTLFDKPHAQVVAALWLEDGGCGPNPHLAITSLRGDGESKPERTEFDIAIFDEGEFVDASICDAGTNALREELLELWEDDGFQLVLTRKGRQLTASLATPLPDGHPSGEAEMTFTTEPITQLRLSGQPGFLFGQANRAGKRESHFWIDAFRIEAVQ
ncbi:MAG: VWA domain-containing protein [Chromatiaceae bacterium]|nr:VWA domain-containing protein [Chromatiaceae bacterium]